MSDAGKRQALGFRVASVTVKGFAIRGETAHLTARLAPSGGGFRLDGLLFIEPEHIEPTLVEDFPGGPAPAGWSIKPVDGGHELVSDKTGEAILGYRVRDGICEITTNIYDTDGPLALAEDGDLIMSGGTIALSEAVAP